MKKWFTPSDVDVRSLDGVEGRPVIDLLTAIEVERNIDVGDHLEAYLEHSRLFGAWRGGELIGGIKLVMGNDDGLPIHEIWPEFNLRGRKDVADLSLLALRHDRRGDLFAMGKLVTAMWRHCLDHGVRELWAEVPLRNLKLYRRFGFPLEQMGEARTYWGITDIPARIVVDETRHLFAWRSAQDGLYRTVIGDAFDDVAPARVPVAN